MGTQQPGWISLVMKHRHLNKPHAGTACPTQELKISKILGSWTHANGLQNKNHQVETNHKDMDKQDLRKQRCCRTLHSFQTFTTAINHGNDHTDNSVVLAY